MSLGPEGESKKREEVGNDNCLASMLAKQQAVCLEQSKRRIQCTSSKGKRNGVGLPNPFIPVTIPLLVRRVCTT